MNGTSRNKPKKQPEKYFFEIVIYILWQVSDLLLAS